MFKKWLKDESRQTLAEYGLLIAVVAVAVIATLVVFRNKLATFNKTATEIDSQNTGSATSQ